jgi:hypothetical protein
MQVNIKALLLDSGDLWFGGCPRSITYTISHASLCIMFLGTQREVRVPLLFAQVFIGFGIMPPADCIATPAG